MSSILEITGADIQRLVSPQDAVDALTELLCSDFDPSDDLHRASFALPFGSFLIMPSAAGDFAGIKIVTVSPDDPQRMAPRIQASYNLYDAWTLTQIALLDGTELTTLRTPAVSMLAIRPFLASLPATVTVIIFGAGPQGQGHALALRAELATHELVANITFVTRVTSVDDIANLLPKADIVICATTSKKPLFDSSLLKNNVIIVAVGSHDPDAREVDAALCRRAHVIVEDRAAALREAGDIIHSIAEGAITKAQLIPLKQLVLRPESILRDRPVFFKSLGMSWEDLAVASAIYTAHGKALSDSSD
ncbi:delta(1)-pyrroline-2-carboxylate reductase family protein [Alpinimonas psychrophila]|uniref:Ornithine cyclodeaminase n=1 Tax=Alpinimonas psychrophila TaxID=748908 RepID=A0A7W3PPS7_9MICO|nr:ornithine cyclodeaminase family protein [Alpinimonas psychrophila]MBA8829636.1 ornithine cyclodeaminase [Alpinimonas psychrophila]